APLRAHYAPDDLVAVGVILFAAATAGLALLNQFAIVALAMLLGGAAWMTVMSSFNVCAQMAPPVWVRARAGGISARVSRILRDGQRKLGCDRGTHERPPVALDRHRGAGGRARCRRAAAAVAPHR